LNIQQRNRARVATYACYASFLALGMSATILGPAYEALAARFSIKVNEAGIFTAVQFAGVTASVLFWGWLLERVNARIVLTLGVGLLGLGLCALAAAQTLPVAILSILLLGVGFGAIDVGPNTVVAALNPEKGGVAVNALNVFFGFGAIVSPQIVNFGLAQKNVSIAFLIVGVFSLLLIVPFLMVNVHINPERGEKVRVNWIALLPYVLLIWLYVGAENGYASWLFTQMRRVTGSTEAAAAFGVSVFWAGLTAGRALASLLLRYVTNLQVLVGSIILIGIGGATLLAFPTSETVALIASFIAGVGCGPVFPTAFVMVTNIAPAARGRIAGVFAAAGTFGAVILPPLQGRIAGERDGGMIVAPLAALGMLVMAFFIARSLRALGGVRSSPDHHPHESPAR
jgi:fucose permease